MKQFLIFILLFGIASRSFGQSDFSTKFKAIPPLKANFKPKKNSAPTPEIPKIITPNVFENTNILNTKPNKDNSTQKGVIYNFSMIPKNEFMNPGDRYITKMEKDLDKSLKNAGLKEDSGPLVYIDVSFGEIRTKSKYFVIKYRDIGQIDGDFAKASLNDAVVEGRLEMKENFQEFKIFFKEGINTFEIEALNKGLLGGNTAGFQIYDAEGKFIKSDYWENWEAGVKGKFIIIKE